MLLFQCDRCKKIDHGTISASKHKEAMIIVQEIKNRDAPCITGVTLDICHDCYESFKIWRWPAPNERESACL